MNIEELAQEYLEKTAETEKDRAHKWGKRGAAASVGAGLANGTMHLARGPGGIKGGLKAIGKGRAAGIVAGASAVNAATGYGSGRLAHRIVKGPASDKKVKKSSVDVEMLAQEFLDQHQK